MIFRFAQKLIEAYENLVGGICRQDIVVDEHTCHHDQKPEEQETSNGSHFFTRFFASRRASDVEQHRMFRTAKTYSRMD